jgi:outer membrane protein
MTFRRSNCSGSVRRSAFASTLFASSIMCTCGASSAQEANWWAHIGVARIMFHEHATLYANGTEVPGGGASTTNNTTLGVEFGYHLTPAWSASIAMGIPPTTNINGSGTAAPFGRIGEVKYGPSIMAAQYRFGNVGALRPYVGGGVVYSKIFATNDGAMQELRVKSTWGSAVQAGVEIPVSKNLGIYADVKQLFLKTTANGVLLGAPASAKVTLNPTVFNFGLAANF